MKAVAWAVLDAEDTVRATLVGRKQAIALAHALDWKGGGGHRVAPLTLADLDDIDDVEPEDDAPAAGAP